jgi:hypothetical protein
MRDPVYRDIVAAITAYRRANLGQKKSGIWLGAGADVHVDDLIALQLQNILQVSAWVKCPLLPEQQQTF